MSRNPALNRCALAPPKVLALYLLPNALSQVASPPVERMQQIIQNYVENKKFMGTVLVGEEK